MVRVIFNKHQVTSRKNFSRERMGAWLLVITAVSLAEEPAQPLKHSP